jgi:hypothetical protein
VKPGLTMRAWEDLDLPALAGVTRASAGSRRAASRLSMARLVAGAGSRSRTMGAVFSRCSLIVLHRDRVGQPPHQAA